MRLFPCQHRCYFACANQVSSNFFSLVLQVSNESLRSLSTLEKLEDITMVCCLFTDDDGLQMLSVGNSLKVITLQACKQSSFALFALLSTHDANECHLAIKFTLPVVVHLLLYTCRSTTSNSTSNSNECSNPTNDSNNNNNINSRKREAEDNEEILPQRNRSRHSQLQTDYRRINPLFSPFIYSLFYLAFGKLICNTRELTPLFI